MKKIIAILIRIILIAFGVFLFIQGDKLTKIGYQLYREGQQMEAGHVF